MSVREHEPVAIVGMGCLFPQSPSLESYWSNIVSARDCISDVPAGHSWSPDDYYDADPQVPDKTWCTRGGFLDPVPFDPLKFGIPPAMLESIDTTQLLSLIVAREALRDAGLDPDGGSWDRDRVSVIIGITGTQEMAITAGARLQGPIWRRSLLRCGIEPALADAIVKDIASHFPTWTEQTFPGLLGNVVSGRIANRLDLGGTNAVVDAACASSLAAMQYAVADLLAHRSDVVLTGGADTLNDIFMYECFTRTPAFTKRGDARPFDASADGILIGEGIAICALKRLADAERDNDRVYAVLRGLGSSSDGRFKSIYAPNPDGQAKALRRTYAMAGFGPETIELVEAHGTGTKAGDSAEIEALVRVYREPGREDRWVTLGSVKSQIGHTKSTAGAAGLVKAALALYQQVLPPTAKILEPNPKMSFETTPFYLSPRARPWIRAADAPRRAAISAFGFGGSNFHAVLEEYGDSGSRRAMSPAAAELFLLSAESTEALERQIDDLIAEIPSFPSLTHAGRASLQRYTPGAPHVASWLASSIEELPVRAGTAKARLAGAAAKPKDEVWIGSASASPVAWLFPGQGSQYVEMGRTLGLRHPAVRAALDAADEDFRTAGIPALSRRTFPPPAWSLEEATAQQEALRATEWAQPAIGALSKGMADLLLQFGLKPDAAAGHSYGELVALHVAGVLDARALAVASRERGRLMGQDRGVDRGGMVAVDASAEQVSTIAARHGLVLANRNHPSQVVLSGEKTALRAAMSELADERLDAKELPVAAAFHSPLVADASAPFRAVLDALPVHPPAIPVISCTTCVPYPSFPDTIRATLAQQLVSPVDWVGVIDALWTSGIRTFIEVGPKGVLAGLTERCLAGREGTVLSIDRLADKEDGDTQLKRVLAVLASLGHRIDPAPLLAERAPRSPMRPSGASVWLAGANHRNPETRDPPMPSLPKPAQDAPTLAAGGVPVADLGWAAIPSSGRPMEKPVHLEMDKPADAPALALTAPRAMQQVAGQPRTDLLALLDSTRETLAAFQDAQARTAEVHGRFLDAVARANDNFARLFEAQARLVEAVALGAPMPALLPSPVALAAPPPEQAVRVASSQIAALDLGPIHLPTSTRPAVATDLPPMFDARAAVEAKSAPQSPVFASKAPPRVNLETALLAAVSAKTGYPRESLELSMDLESDLGIDSIKRVEILSAVRESVPGLPEVADDKLSALRTLADVVGALHIAGAHLQAPVSVPVTRAFGRKALVEAMLAAVSAKTGYPRESLELSMDLESDLGIDSIKRVEILSAVRESVPGLPEVADDKLSALRTLADVVDALDESGQLPLVPDVLRPKATLSREQIVGTLLDAVSVKTGYPRESLELSMDLESDLGIDSIKRVEILSAVRERLPELPDVGDDVMTGLRRLSDVADHLGGVALGLGFALIGSQSKTSATPALIVPPAAAPLPVPVAPGVPPVQSISDLFAAEATPAASVSVSLRRGEVALMTAPPHRERAPFQGRFVLTADRGCALAEAVARALGSRGIEAFVIDPDWNGSSIAVPEGCTGAVHLAAIGSFGADAQRRVQGAFLLAKALEPKTLRRFVTISDRGGRFGRALAGGDPVSGALAGLAKTIAIEWPTVASTALDIAQDVEVERIIEELLGDRGVVEVGIEADRAWTLVSVPTVPRPARLPLDSKDLLVATGGGRGVTAACLVALARHRPLSVLLLGRTEIQKDPDWALSVPNEGLVGKLLSRQSGRPLPREAERIARGVCASREIRSTMEALLHEGCAVTYVSVDGRDTSAVREAVTAAVARHGPVRAIVHGAGVLADRKLTDKTVAQFQDVWSTKVDGWHALLASIDEQQLRLSIVFTSVAGRYGNAGQCDYAMANEALVHETLALAARAPHVRARAIDWGPWQGGMVTPSLEAHFAGQGIGVIPLVLGAEAFVETAMCDGDELVVEGPRPVSGEIAIPLYPQTPWLQDHTIDTHPVLPVAMVVEWAATLGAELAAGQKTSVVRDLRVLKGVVLDHSEQKVMLSWHPGGGRKDVFSVELRSGKAVPHYRAVIEIDDAAAPVTLAPRGQRELLMSESFEGEIYSHLFHGPAYQVIEEVLGISDLGAVARVRTRTPVSVGVPKLRWQTDPIAIDAALQLMLLWVRVKRGSGALPTALGTVCWRNDGSSMYPERLDLELHVEGTASTGRFSALFRDLSGHIIGWLDGGEYSAMTSLLRTLHPPSPPLPATGAVE